MLWCRRRWDPSRLTSRAVQLSLLGSWVALVVWKVMTYLEEPTGSETRFVDHFRSPLVTVCPYHGLSQHARDVIYDYSYPEQVRYFGNGSLQKMFSREGLSLLDMMPYLRNTSQYKADPRRDNYTERDGNWTTKFNYAEGGLCGTFEVTGNFPSMAMARRKDFHESKEGLVDNFVKDKVERRNTKPHIAYLLYIHRLADFWGARDIEHTPLSDAEMVTFNVLDTTDFQEIVIVAEREIMPNMRRRPCVEDPSYSRSTCWRDCFFEKLNCSVLEDKYVKDEGKPPCNAADIIWYYRAYTDFAYTTDTEGEFLNFTYPCMHACPHPCILDRYSVSVRPSYVQSDKDYILFQLSLKPVMRTVETKITYGLVDLMADMGGFLGLFLGYSILSVFDDFKSFTARILGRHHPSIPATLKHIRPLDTSFIRPERHLDKSFIGAESGKRHFKAHLHHGIHPELTLGIYNVRPAEGTAWTGHTQGHTHSTHSAELHRTRSIY